jgi:hypothetical protein
MGWFSGTRLAVLIAVAVVFIMLMVTASTVGMFGTMFEGFFGPAEPAATPGSGSSAQVRLTPTVRR